MRPEILRTLTLAGALCLAPLSSHAVVITKTNAVFASLDGTSATRTVDVLASDLTGSTGVIQDVDIFVSFAKCSGPIDPAGGCVNPQAGLRPFLDDITIRLDFGAGSSTLVTQTTYTIPATGDGGQVAVTFDDEAATGVGPDFVSGTFNPDPGPPLSVFDGLNALGTWSLFLDDAVGIAGAPDPLGFYSLELRLTLEDDAGTTPPPGGVPAPGTLLLLGFGLFALGAGRFGKR